MKVASEVEVEVAVRPVDLARAHGISAQAVRNYEQQGALPPAGRTPAGHRVYTQVHAAALRAFRALAAAHGHAVALDILHAVHRGDLDAALRLVDDAHDQLRRDRAVLDAVGVGPLADQPPAVTEPFTVGELAHRLGVVAATLRKWERAGVLRPARDPRTGYRRYRAEDVRDADLAHLLRRGGHPLARTAVVVDQVRAAGGTEALAASLADWRHRLTVRGLAMLDAAGALADYVRSAEPGAGDRALPGTAARR